MSRAALVVHSYSYPYIKNVTNFIHSTIQAYLDAASELLICDTVDAAPYDENTLVFLIGEKFPPFERRAGCTYIYLNFSVVTVLGRPWETGLKARRGIRTKRRLLDQRLHSVDLILDYFPPQTKALRRELNVPVLGFTVATANRAPFKPMQDRAFDVCFVGGLNHRRQSVCDAITALNLSLSPSQGIDIEDAATASRVCLNVHSVKSHHLESPRFVAGLSSGTPVVTEPSFGASAAFDPRYAIESSYVDLPTTIVRLLSDPQKLDVLGRKTQSWYRGTYLPQAQNHWCGVLEKIVEFAREKPFTPSVHNPTDLRADWAS